jgi:membrane associated rhomboid family serine protease
MLILPLPARPDWGRPPLVTLLIMLLCLIAFLMQGSDQQRSADAWRFYQQSGAAKIETAAYLADLERRGKADALRGELKHIASGKPDEIYRAMEEDQDFMRRLRGNQVITPGSPDYSTWRASRTHFETLRARIVTENYALNGQEPRLATLFTHMFLHGDIMHLSGNMAVLFVVGYTVEAALGPLGFLGLYLLGGLGSALPDLLLPATGHRLSLGASGAISAVMAAYLVLFGRRRINFFYWLFFFFGTVRWPALAILPIWLANELLQNFVLDRGGHINYLAHFAGLLSGALLVGVYRWRRQGKSAETVLRQDSNQAIEAIRLRAEEHLADMQFGLAALQYRKLFAEHPLADPRLASEYLHIARLTQQAELQAEANRQFLKSAADHPKATEPTLLAEALDAGPGTTPTLSVVQWEGLVARLIDGRQLDTAERLIIRLFSRPNISRATEGLANRLANAFTANGQPERVPPVHRLLSGRAVSAES